MDGLQLAILFHETYERLAPSFGYETRPDTKAFDPESKNGKLMVATCSAIQQHLAAAPAPEPSAWTPVSKSGLMRGIRAGKPTAEDLAIAEADGDSIQYFIAAPNGRTT